MEITFDSEADALYIRLSTRRPDHGMDVEEGVTVDLDKHGHIVGIEILDASRRLRTDNPLSVTVKDLAHERQLATG